MMDLQKGAADKHTIHFSVGAIYILWLAKNGVGKGAGTLPVFRLSMLFPKCLRLAQAGLADCGWRTDTLKAFLQAGGQAWWQGCESHSCLFFSVEPHLVCLTSRTSVPSPRKWRCTAWPGYLMCTRNQLECGDSLRNLYRNLKYCWHHYWRDSTVWWLRFKLDFLLQPLTSRVPWRGYFQSLNISFLICKMMVKKAFTS